MAIHPPLASIAWNPLGSVNVAGALAVMLFGLLVAVVPPRGWVQRGFGFFACCWGAITLVANLALMSAPDDAWLRALPWLSAALGLGAVAGLLLLWRHMPVRLAPHERWMLLPAAAAAVPFLGWTAYALDDPARVATWAGAAMPIIISTGPVWGAWCGLLLLLALRHMGTDAAPTVRKQAPILSVGLVLYLAVNVRWALPGQAPAARFEGSLVALFVIGLAALWLAASAKGITPRTARHVAWTTLGAAFLGMLHESMFEGRATIVGVDGLARLATVMVLSVAILRHEALGIHARLRFGISKSTLAAVFIAVFFVASEGAQVLFSEFAGNELIGIVAAGMLVFAIAPLQRLADRFALKAVPAASTTATGGRDAEESYRNALRWALAKHPLDADEERRLLLLAEDLGISTRRALALRADLEARHQGVPPTVHRSRRREATPTSTRTAAAPQTIATPDAASSRPPGSS